MERNILAEGVILRERFSITGVLGEGAYGVVYGADDITASGARWAVKEIQEGALTDEERRKGRELFDREVALLRTLDHVGVPKIIDSFTQGNHHYIVMECIDGETIEDRMRNHPPVEEVLGWAVQLCDILEYLHSLEPSPMIFRDMKPSNVMVTSCGRVMLIDFGIARFFNPYKVKDTFVLGTPGFSPPEQYGRKQSDARSDIYSLCATVYYLLCEKDLEKFGFFFPPLSKFCAQLPPGLDTLLSRGLQLDPRHRYSHVGELREELKKVLSGEGADSPVSGACQALPSSPAPLQPLTPSPVPSSSAPPPAVSASPACTAGSFPSVGWLWGSLLLLVVVTRYYSFFAVFLTALYYAIPLYSLASLFHGPTRKKYGPSLVISIIFSLLMWVLLPDFLKIPGPQAGDGM
jgi:serine/threonine protein kinase